MQPFDLQHAVATWRRSLEFNPVFSEEDLDELERHVLDQVRDLEGEGHSTERAYRIAIREMGSFHETEDEFRKTRWASIKKRKRMKKELMWRFSIVVNYAQIAVRTFKKHPLYALLNVGGLTIGFVVCFLIFLFIQHERSYDRWFDRAEDIYRVTSRGQSLATSGALAPALIQDFPQIESATRVSKRWANPLIKWDDTSAYEEKFMFADSSFFEIFDFELVQGNPVTALSHPFSVVLTESAAQAYFGDADPMGQTLNIKSLWDAFDFTVTGVVKDSPRPSHLDFNMIGSFVTRFSAEPYPENVASWFNVGDLTYLKLKPGQHIETVASQIPDFVLRHLGEKLRETDKEPESLKQRIQFQSVIEAHFSPKLQGELGPGSDPRYMFIFGIIAAIVLVIASVNYINLATAQSISRAREVGVRKVVGAGRSQIVWQFLAESGCVVGVSILLSVAVTALVLPFFGDLTGKQLGMFELMQPSVLVFVLATGFVVSLLSGFYPAMVMSGFKPVQTLKGLVTKKSKNVQFRHVLVVGQFVAAAVLIMGALVVYNQLEFMQSKNLGMNPDQVIILDNKALSRTDTGTMKELLLANSSVLSVSGLYGKIPFDPNQHMTLMKERPTGQLQEGETWKEAIHTSVGLDFLKTMEIELLKGRDFTELDLARGQDFTPILVNEAAVRLFEWDDPIGEELKCCWSPVPRVVGVIKDFHFESLQAPIGAIALMPSTSLASVLIRVEASRTREALGHLEAVWKSLAPGVPFKVTFMDDEFAAAYSAELRLARVFGIFASLAVLIACLGLFGLSTFMAQNRTREIGVRKVMGAAGKDIVLLLSRDFLALVVVSLLIAIPVAINLSNQWLQEFPYRTTVGVGLVVLTAGALILIALATVSFQSNRAANINPADALRHE